MMGNKITFIEQIKSKQKRKKNKFQNEIDTKRIECLYLKCRC